MPSLEVAEWLPPLLTHFTTVPLATVLEAGENDMPEIEIVLFEAGGGFVVLLLLLHPVNKLNVKQIHAAMIIFFIRNDVMLKIILKSERIHHIKGCRGFLFIRCYFFKSAGLTSLLSSQPKASHCLSLVAW
jgi:hypothetical protein